MAHKYFSSIDKPWFIYLSLSDINDIKIEFHIVTYAEILARSVDPTILDQNMAYAINEVYIFGITNGQNFNLKTYALMEWNP